MRNLIACSMFVLCSVCQVKAFASPFSDLWTVSGTFNNGGFEGDVRLPVLSRTTSGWEMTIRFDKPVKGFKMWRGKIQDVGPDFTYYVVTNEAWNAHLQRGSTFEFHILGYSQDGLPSMEINFQNQVFGRTTAAESSQPDDEIDANFVVDYDQVLGLSLQLFEAKRSGKLPEDNRISWKGDTALYDGGAEGFDLTGGYYIGGDFVKFGFPMAFAMTQLAWGGLEYAGGYQHAGETVNLLKAVKWGTDYFLKAHVEDDVLFGMVGDPSIGHGIWEGGFSINWRRPAFKVTTGEPGSDIAAETAASLASAAMLFSNIDTIYSTELTRHAEKLYLFADTSRGKYDTFSIPGASGFYPSTDFGDELVWAALWLHKATNQRSYLDDAISKYDEFRLASKRTDKGLDYDNKILAVQLLLSEITGEYDTYITPVLQFCDKWSGPGAPLTPDGLLQMQNVKSDVSFSANTAFLCSLAAEQTLNSTAVGAYKTMAANQVSEILGKNTGVSYMVGYGEGYPTSLHDRESSCPSPPRSCGWDFFKSPYYENANQLTGALVGGPGDDGALEDTRKNFVGNQPNILYNSAFQSAVAAILYFNIGLSGTSVVALDPADVRTAVFPPDITSQFDACISDPCENNGECSNIEGFNYLCVCPDNVFGRNCENRLTPVLKWINTWNIGAEIHFQLPNVRPNKPWQLKTTFPEDCPLEEIDVWNACLNVLDSSREKGEIFLQQIDWQRDVEFIGMRFQFTDPKFVRNCFREESFSFLIIEEAAVSLIYRTADNCPRELPHAFEGSGSGYFENFLVEIPETTTESTTTTTRIELPFDLLPTVPELPFDLLPTVPAFQAPVVLIPTVPSPIPTTTDIPRPVTTAVAQPTEKSARLEWISTWGSGGQGHIHVQDSRPNDAGEWTLRVKFPDECAISGAQFWAACTVGSLNDPRNGLFVLEQIDWQIHQSFIGFTVHFLATNGLPPNDCFSISKYNFAYEVSPVAYNYDVNACPKEFSDVTNYVSSGSDKSARGGGVPAPAPTVRATVIPPDFILPQTTPAPLPSVARLKANMVSGTIVQLTWREPPTSVDNVEFLYHPVRSDIVPGSNTEEDLAKLKKSAAEDDFIKAVEQRIQIPRTTSSVTVRELLPGMRYQFTARLMGNDKSGPSTSVFITTTPNDVQNMRAVSVDGNTIRLSWLHAKGVHETYRVTYFPESDQGQPRSPFYLPGNATSVDVTGLSTNTDFIVSMVTKSGSSMSDGAYVFAKTVPDQCSATSCSLNEICENDVTGPKCVCTRGYSGPPCTDNDECIIGEHVCHVNATCHNTIGSYECSCKSGFTGDGIACYDVDECSVGRYPCIGPCINTIGSYICACDEGYTGEVGRCVDIDECSAGLASCPDNSSCVNNDGSYTCSCGIGAILTSGECVDIDECREETHNCPAFSVCVNSDGSYTCLCAKGFLLIGNICEDLDECVAGTHVCHALATCHNVVGGYRCDCNPGYHGNGRMCTDVDECTSGGHACSANAVCRNTDGGHECVCVSGYTGDGTTCQALFVEPTAAVDECSLGSHLCDEHATCSDTPESYTCLCKTGYAGNGTHCTDIDECSFAQSSSLCPAPNSRCVNMEGTYRCACDQGWRSELNMCVDVDECALAIHSCHRNAMCSNEPGTYTCICNAGYVGDGRQCDDINECSPFARNNCSIGALCTNTQGSYSCSCGSGYEGNGLLCNDIDECAAELCHDDADCANTPGSFVCSCKRGYTGNGLTDCTDVDECSDPALSGCDANAGCLNGQGSYRCNCNAGFYGNGSACYDANECIADHGCHDNADCINEVGGYACSCRDGFRGDGVTCDDVDECERDHSCYENSDCVNEQGSFSCVCHDGFHGNGTSCEDVNECESGAHGCHDKANCVNTVGGRSCECESGYHGDGASCEDVNECKGDHDCHENSHCVNEPATYSCICNHGYSGNGTSCDDINECEGNHGCHENSDCVNEQGTFSCICHNGFHGNGTSCDDVNECEVGSHGCHNNSDCVNIVGGYSCVCHDGFHGNGTSCDDTDECNDDHGCHGNADCFNEPGSYSCVCRDGYHGNGTFCYDVDECENHGCHENAECFNGEGEYACVCHEGFHGDGLTCDDVNECSGDHGCHENSECINEIGGYTCACKGGFTQEGTHCEDVDECVGMNVTCSVNGHCMNTKGSFECVCDDGYQGDGVTCDDVNECLTDELNKCDVNAECLNDLGSYRCSCYAGFHGDGVACDDEDECAANTHDCDAVTSSCRNTLGTYDCDCKEGYARDRTRYASKCYDVDECVTGDNDCDVNAICANSNGSYTCECTKYYEGDGKTCESMFNPVTCHPRDIVFLIDRTSSPEVYKNMLDFVRTVTFPMNLGTENVQVGVATFYTRTFKSAWLRQGTDFDSLALSLKRTQSYGPVANSKRNLASALKWVRQRFLIPSQGKSRKSVPTSVIVMLSGPSHEVIFNELLTYDSLSYDLKFITLGNTSLANISTPNTLHTSDVINVPDPEDLSDHVTELTRKLCPEDPSLVQLRLSSRIQYTNTGTCPTYAAIDLVFAIDSRTKIVSNNFPATKEFMRKIVEVFHISSNDTRVGLVQFAGEAYTNLHLMEGTDQSEVLSSINAMEGVGHGQKLNEVLSLVKYVEFHPLMGRRSDRPAFAVLLTGSRSLTTIEELEFWRDEFHLEGAHVITVGVGSAEADKLTALSGESTFRPRSLDDLTDTTALEVVNEICRLNAMQGKLSS